MGKRTQKFTADSLKVKQLEDLAPQMLVVPFDLTDTNGQTIPVQGWFVSPIIEDEKNSVL